MRTMTWAAAAAMLVSAAAAGPVSAQTWYKPAPASGVATGNLTFNTNTGPIECAATVPWHLTGGYVRLDDFILTGNFCDTISFAQIPRMMVALPSPPPNYNAAFAIGWISFPSQCISTPNGYFDNATSTMTVPVYGSSSCTISGTLTFPDLQLLP